MSADADARDWRLGEPSPLEAAAQPAAASEWDPASVACATHAETSLARTHAALTRLAAADLRDDAARARDLACDARDLEAAARDRLLAPHESEAVAEVRQRAAQERQRAAADRRRAAEDREQARRDREELRAALTEAHVDDLTGTYRRGMGTIALEHEIDRARRASGRLVLACVDVDALKAHNDRGGHAAGDRLLVAVVTSIRANLRSYDPVVRFGGDEFVCALPDADLADAATRFEAIQATLRICHPGASISVGFAQLEDGSTLDTLIARGDAELYAAKQRG